MRAGAARQHLQRSAPTRTDAAADPAGVAAGAAAFGVEAAQHELHREAERRLGAQLVSSSSDRRLSSQSSSVGPCVPGQCARWR